MLEEFKDAVRSYAEFYDAMVYLKTNEEINEAFRWMIKECEEGTHKDFYPEYLVDMVCLYGELGDITKSVYGLPIASELGYMELVKALIEDGVDVTAEDNLALANAAYKGHYEIFKLLIKNGASPKSESNYCLRWSSANNKFEIVEYLLENYFFFPDDLGQALNGAATNGHLEIVKLLLKYGANISYNDSDGFRSACFNSHVEIVKLLIENGADIYLNDLSENANYYVRELLEDAR